MLCFYCGRQIPDDSEQCPYCGPSSKLSATAVLTDNEETEAQSKNESSNDDWIKKQLTSLAVVSCVIVLAFTILGTLNNTNSIENPNSTYNNDASYDERPIVKSQEQLDQEYGIVSIDWREDANSLEYLKDMPYKMTGEILSCGKYVGDLTDKYYITLIAAHAFPGVDTHCYFSETEWNKAPDVASGDLVTFYGYYDYWSFGWDFRDCSFESPAGMIDNQTIKPSVGNDASKPKNDVHNSPSYNNFFVDGPGDVPEEKLEEAAYNMSKEYMQYFVDQSGANNTVNWRMISYDYRYDDVYYDGEFRYILYSTVIITGATYDTPPSVDIVGSAWWDGNQITNIDFETSDFEYPTVKNGYLLPTDTRYITPDDLRPFTKEEVVLIRNEIYARYGYTFHTDYISEYFMSQDWYWPDPNVNSSTFNTSNMTDIERKNLETITQYERDMGWRGSTNNDYLLPTDSRYITPNDLRQFTKDEIVLIRNEIYARHGYTFNTDHIREYFMSQDWYRPDPNVNSSTFGPSNMTEIEQKNLATITKYERDMGWK